MNDHLLVEALSARDPDGPGAVYTAYADRLYAYCWFQLRSRDTAQVALRDTFVVAEAHIDKLRDPDRFGPWLYAIARLECGRRLPGPDQPPDLPVATHDQEDVDQRVMAWQAVLALPPRSREMLELRVRHRLSVPDLSAVFGLPAKETQAALDRAHADLEAALAAELLAAQGPYGCAERGALLRERHGEPSADLSRRMQAHARWCDDCAPYRPRPVSATRVYGLLPQAEPPVDLRIRVMSCFLDPELVGYRLFVATRITDFGAGGFPAQLRRSPGARGVLLPGGRWWRGLRRASGAAGISREGARLVGFFAAAVLLLTGVVAAFQLSGQHGREAGTTSSGASPRPSLPTRFPPPTVPGAHTGENEVDAVPVSATFPLGARASSAPPTALPSPPPRRDYQAAPGNGSTAPLPPGGSGTLTASPLYLDLAGGSDGSIELRAEGGPVNWQATTWGPVRLAQPAGRLAAGQSMTLGVHVFRSARSQGEGGITFKPGGLQVHVTWRPGPTPTDPPTTGPPTSGPPTTGPPTTTPPPPSSPGPSHPGTTRPPSSEPPPRTDPPSSEPPPSSDPPPPSSEPPPSSDSPPSSSTPETTPSSGPSPGPQGSGD